jgi:hypothetical protein
MCMVCFIEIIYQIHYVWTSWNGLTIPHKKISSLVKPYAILTSGNKLYKACSKVKCSPLLIQINKLFPIIIDSSHKWNWWKHMSHLGKN